MYIQLIDRDFFREFRYSATRSSGAGGQNVNKVNSRVELRFSVKESKILSDDEKELVFYNLATRINSEGELVISSQTERSQYLNKVEVTERFYKLIAQAITKPEERIPSVPSRAAVIKRMKDKIKQSQKKQRRKIIDFE